MGGRGGSYSRSGFLGPHGKQKTVEEALAGANPHYREGREWQQNCQRCIYAYEMQRRGYDVEALPRIFDGTDRLPYMYDKNGWLAVMDGAKAVDFPSRNTIQKMADQMANWGRRCPRNRSRPMERRQVRPCIYGRTAKGRHSLHGPANRALC